ncbi:MAG: hypothetical protein SGI84_07995 [Gemmatimonadota bacterium]|nr:hypothetical protein [Gemmatimonadota bacterium]
MATKKQVSKKPPTRGKAATPRQPKRGDPSRPCVPEEICAYLKALSKYLRDFNQDYIDLRIAMCNVEEQAFSCNGDTGERFGPCRAKDNPKDPPKPPVWSRKKSR